MPSNLFIQRDIENINWFINLRWLALLGVGLAVFLAQHVFHFLPPKITVPLWLGVFSLLTVNTLFAKVKNKIKNTRAFLLWQIAADLAILTYLIHFSGGIENPLCLIYVFHVILAGILVSPRDVYRVASITAALFLLMALGEYFHILPHYTLSLFPHEHALEGSMSHAAHKLPFVLGMSGALLFLLGVTAYFTSTITKHLQESQRQLLQAERLSALGQLVGYIAHEINNPIGIISTRMKLMKSNAQDFMTPAFLKETLDIVERQADRVAQVVKSLLGFFKPLAQPKTLVNLNQALQEALSIAEPRISKTGIVVERSFYPNLPKIHARVNDLVHIFLNLINNATDAMPRGGILRIQTQTSNGFIEASIKDTGEGIPRENINKIFEPFFTTKGEIQGTGLGLPIARSLAKGFGGEILVESLLGKGSTFVVRLPTNNHV